MRLHNTNNSNFIWYSNFQYRENELGDMKPSGLWYSINNEWIDWCKSEMPEWIRNYFYEIDIDESKILILSNENEIISFHQKYNKNIFDSKIIRSTFHSIDWNRVKKDYSGIEIQNYDNDIMGLRLAYTWYYSWDCSSGCIWSENAVKNITLVDKRKLL